MPKYLVTDSDGQTKPAYTADSVMRDGDWIMLTKAAPQMEERRVEKPRDLTNISSQPEIMTIQVATGRITQQPVAYFYKPRSVELIVEAPAAVEKSDQ